MEGSWLARKATHRNNGFFRTFACRASVAAAFLLFAPAVHALTGPVVYSQNFEVTPLTNWTLDPPWGVTTSDHVSGAHSLTDSPGGPYADNVDASAKVQVDLTTVARPVLTFRHRYEFENYADFGYVEISTDGSTWQRVFFVTGSSGGMWAPDPVQIDLSSYGYQKPWLRFHVVTNASLHYDGWYIDDVQVVNNTTTLAYPFFDDVESAGSASNWIASTWGRSCAVGHSGACSWTDSPLGNSVGGVSSSLVLAGTLDLSHAVNPQLSYWQHIPEQFGSYDVTQVWVSPDRGQSWTKLKSSGWDNTPIAGWAPVQLDLTPYASSTVLVRFTFNGGDHDGWYLDDVVISNNGVMPPTQTATPTGPTATPTRTPTATWTRSPSATPSITPTSSTVLTPTRTPTSSVTSPTQTPTLTPTAGGTVLPARPDDLTLARAVGIERSKLRASGLRVNGQSFVGDLHWERNRLRLVENSLTQSVPPTISNLQAQVFPSDTATCGTQFPERVQLIFDYQDPNGDLLGGRVGVGYQATPRTPPGLGPVHGEFVGTFFPQPQPGLALDPPTGTNGTVSITTCFGNVAHMDFSVSVKDADENLSPELTLSVDIPAGGSAAAPAASGVLEGASGMALPKW